MRRLIILLVALTVAVAAFYLVPQPLPELTRAEFLAEIHAGHVRSVVIEDRRLIVGASSTRGQFRTGFSPDEDAGLPAELRSLGVEVRFEKSPLGLI